MAETVDVAIRVLATISRLLFVLTWPFVKLARGVALLLSPVWTVAQFILLPLTVVVQAVLSILLFPFRLNWLDRFETIYIYLGIATLIGFLAGAVLYLSFNFLTSTLRIDSSRSISALESKTRRKPRTTVEYRADRDKRKGIVPVPSTTLRGDMASQRQRGLLAQTIIEEEDSDF